MKEETLELKTNDGVPVLSNGHGAYAVSAGGGVTIKVQYPKSCLSEKTMARILEQAAMQTGKPCIWVPGPAVETFNL